MALVGNITIDDDDVEALLTRLDTAVSPRSLVQFLGVKVDPYMRGRAAARFGAEGDDASGKWAPLTSTTVHFRETEGFPGSHPINVRTGDLEDYIVGTEGLVIPTERGGILQMPGRVVGGVLGEKFKTAQQGKADPHTRARPVLAMNEQDMRQVLTLLMFHIGEGL